METERDKLIGELVSLLDGCEHASVLYDDTYIKTCLNLARNYIQHALAFVSIKKEEIS
jgi:hypothetical protein